MIEEALIIFIKNPERGKVKTRLAKTLGKDKALRIYKALLDHTRKLAESLPANRYLFYSDYINQNDLWEQSYFHKQLQSEGDLGLKMETAFKEVLQNHQKAVIIGSDCASLNATIIKEAFSKLEKFPFVIGPALDGGYYLLGMTDFSPQLFRNISWSTDSVFKTTIDRINQLGKSCHLLPTLSDIDHESDWKKYGWSLED